jgi:hypothetical protein
MNYMRYFISFWEGVKRFNQSGKMAARIRGAEVEPTPRSFTFNAIVHVFNKKPPPRSDGQGFAHRFTPVLANL